MNAIFIGRRAQGKSTLALYVAERVQKRIAAHIIPIFDPKRTYRCIPHTNNSQVFAQMLISPGARSIAYQPFTSAGDMQKRDNLWDEFSVFCDSLGIEKHLGDETPSRPDLGPVVVIIDEAWFLQPSPMVIHPWVENLVRLADHKSFFLFQCAHRPGDIAPRISAQADEFFYFRQWLPRDVEIIEDNSGAEIADAVSQLPDHHVIRFEVSSGTWELWQRPEVWYRNISAECKGGDDGSDDNADARGKETDAGSDSEFRGSDEGASSDDGSTPPGDGKFQQVG